MEEQETITVFILFQSTKGNEHLIDMLSYVLAFSHCKIKTLLSRAVDDVVEVRGRLHGHEMMGGCSKFRILFLDWTSEMQGFISSVVV